MGLKSLPKFSVENPVLVSVMMLALLIGGAYCALTMTREMFPESRPDQVVIITPYPGATPAEVEKGVSTRIEEEIKDIQHIDKIETTITEGLSTVIVTLTSDVRDYDAKVNEIKSAVDAIPRNELPEEAEETRVMKFEPRLPVIMVSLYGDVGADTLKRAGRQLRDDLLLIPGITDVVVSGIRKDEISVEVEPEKLIKYGLSLTQVAEAIRQHNLDLPAGRLKTTEQNVAIRTLGETDEVNRIAETILRTTVDGKVVRVADVGRVIDTFEDTDVEGRFDGKPAVSVTVYKTGDQDAIDIAEKVKAFVAGKRHEEMHWSLLDRVRHKLGFHTEALHIYQQAWNSPYPPTTQVKTHSDLSRFIQGRLDLLTEDGIFGLALLFITLMIFMNWKIAWWTMTGLLAAVCGSLILMIALGETLNLISMFGLILVLGLTEDDAIVIGENVYTRVENGQDPHLAAVEGAQEVFWPVVAAVLINIAGFLPLMFIEGRTGDMMKVLPVIVCAAFVVSMFESLIMLPSHLAESLKVPRKGPARESSSWFTRTFGPIRERQAVIQRWFGDRYEAFLRKAVAYRYVTVAAAFSILLMTLGFVVGGRAPFVFFPKVDSETIVVNLEMPVGTPAERTREVLRQLEEAALTLEARTGKREIESIYSLVGAQIDVERTSASSRSHLGQAMIELVAVDHRDRTSEDIIADLRKTTNRIPGIESLRYMPMNGGPIGAEIQIEVTGEQLETTRAAAEELKAELSRFAGVFDVADDFEEGRREVQLLLRDSARPLGITTRMLATEVRGAFYGLEARTLQRDREDVDIRVQYPPDRRRNIYEVESMRIATPDGHMVPIREVAHIEEGEGFSAIRRVDQRRAVVVSADVDQGKGNSDLITAELTPFLHQLERKYPGTRIYFAGSKLEAVKAFGSLKRDFVIAMLSIYVILVALFKSYVQPLIVLAAVPCGLIGVVVGHWVMGFPITILSMIGTVALTGIVVNDTLILVDFINTEIKEGHPLREAVIHGGRRRLRAILLTSVTSIVGLGPLMAETSFQAKFLIPMAISVSYGLAFATLLTLVVVPALYVITDDLQMLWRRLWHGPAGAPAMAPAVEAGA